MSHATPKSARYKYNPKGYIRARGWLNYGLPTTVICGVIYYFLNARGGDMPLVAVGADIWMSVFITIFICAVTAIPGIRVDIRKGTAPVVALPKWSHPVYRCFANHPVLQSLQFAALATLIFGFGLGGILAIVAVMSGDFAVSFSPVIYWILKSVYSGLFVALTLCWVTSCTLSQYSFQE